MKNLKIGALVISALLAIQVSISACSAPATKPDAAQETAALPTLRFGDSGPDVKFLQTGLKQLGFFQGDVLGNFQTLTLAAVKAFQAAKGLTADGIVGPVTNAALVTALREKAPEVPGPVSPTPDPSGTPALSWDNSTRRPWSIALHGFISDPKVFPRLKAAQDLNRFCPKAASLNDAQLKQAWAELFIGTMQRESSWVPTTRYYEKTMGYYSEGLLQLSYPDKQWATWCRFDEKGDAKYPADDPRRTILNPEINMECGVGIMARQIDKFKKIVVKQGLYWAVLREGSPRVTEIATRVSSVLPFCR